MPNIHVSIVSGNTAQIHGLSSPTIPASLLSADAVLDTLLRVLSKSMREENNKSLDHPPSISFFFSSLLFLLSSHLIHAVSYNTTFVQSLVELYICSLSIHSLNQSVSQSLLPSYTVEDYIDTRPSTQSST
jgi:hypothetical protein